MQYKATITIKNKDNKPIVYANRIYTVNYNSIYNNYYSLKSEIGRIKIPKTDFDKFGLIKIN